MFTAVGGMMQIWQQRMTSCRKQPEMAVIYWK
jgi:hypothetical protein